MEGKILDEFDEQNSKCLLTSIKLHDYISNLPDNYKSYDVQREIVKNSYLDNLISTIINHNHIPPIVLVVEDQKYTINESIVEVSEFKILDGLQRTFRLKVIYDTIELLKESLQNNRTEILDASRFKVAKMFKDQLINIDSTSSLIYELINKVREKSTFDLDKLFDRTQWFEIWVGLSPDDEVNKMLVLNAGHKPVKTKHQLELLFRSIIPILQGVEFPDFQLIREKEMSSTKYSKERSPGQFHFSHLITSILSLSEGKPLTTNINLIQKTQADYFDDEIFEYYLKLDFLKEFIRGLLEIDKAISNEFQDIGTKWMGRETSLVGLYSATGKFIEEQSMKPVEGIKILKDKIVANPKMLALNDFEEQRNSLDLAKINIGNVNKRAVYDGIYSFLIGQLFEIDWSSYFNKRK